MASQICIGARGEIIIEDVPTSELSITESGDIIETMQAGERLGTILERKRVDMGLSLEDVVEKLPIRIGPYARIESGFNSRPPDDILQAIAKVLKLNFNKLKEVGDLDFAEPVEFLF